MSIFPDNITIKILDKIRNTSVAGIAAKVRLFSNHKNDYYFILPLSDDKGCIVITKRWLSEEIKKEKNMFIMDYSSELEDCKSQIEIIILDKNSLSRAISAMELYQDELDISDEDILKYKNASNYKYTARSEVFILDSSKSDIEINMSIEEQGIQT